MDRERIELSAKAKLEGFLLQLGYITPEFSSNDKTPSWDGFIRLYNDKDVSAKANLVKMIPVQIKGHFQNPPYAENISFQVDVADLRNYLNHNGVIFFAVYVGENDKYKIYYNALTPLKLRRIIKGKETQNSVSISLSAFPEQNKEEIIDIFFNFSNEMKMPLPRTDITLDDAIEQKIQGFDVFNLTYSGIKYKKDPFGYFLAHPATVSLVNTMTGISFPIDTIFLQSIGSKVNKPICVADVVYYDTFEILRQRGNDFVLKFGKSFTICLSRTEENVKEKFNFTIRGNLEERIRDIKFLLAYFEHKELSIGNYKGFLLDGNEVSSVDISYYQGNLKLLEKVDELLKMLHIKTILDYDKVSEKDEETLILLINTVLLGAPCIPDSKNVLYNLQIANINILLTLTKIEGGNYKVINYFSDENKIEPFFAYENKERRFLVPRCFVLSADDFSLLDNIDYDMVYNDIISSQNSDELKEPTYFFVKNMITGFVKRTKSKEGFSECIKKSLCFLKEKVSDFDYEELWRDFINECTDKSLEK